MKLGQLKNEIEKRRYAQGHIKERINAYCKKNFGIENFFLIANKHFPKQDSFQICLARQVPMPNIEHLSLYLAANEWGISPMFLSLVRDTFPQRGINNYKKSIISIPLLKKGRKGGLIVNCKRVSDQKNLQGAIFSELKSHCGKTLPEFHWEMMKKAIPEEEIEKKDLSNFFSELFL